MLYKGSTSPAHITVAGLRLFNFFFVSRTRSKTVSDVEMCSLSAVMSTWLLLTLLGSKTFEYIYYIQRTLFRAVSSGLSLSQNVSKMTPSRPQNMLMVIALVIINVVKFSYCVYRKNFSCWADRKGNRQVI